MRRASTVRFTFGVALLAGVALGCGRPREPKVDFSDPKIPGTDIVVAEVKGEPITAGEIYQKIRTQYPRMAQSGPGLGAQAKEVAKQVVTERCLADYGMATGDDQAKDFLLSLFFARISLLSQIAVRNRITDRVTPSDAQIDSFYQANHERFFIPDQVWWRHIVVGSQTEARRVLGELRAGGDFQELARRYSTDKMSAPRGGDMPEHPRGPRVAPFGDYPDLDAALFALPVNQLSEPVHTIMGWHILQVTARREGHERPVEEVKGEIAAKFVMQREPARYKAVVESLRLAYQVRIDDDALDRFHRLQMNEDELFDAAQNEPDPARQLKLYQDIRERYPQGARAPEALFMIGFVYQEKLKDSTHAVETLQAFLKQYPDHAMAASARSLIDEARRGGGAAGSGG
jgi:peptidyl-prolyl cis-trans isomerase C